MMASHFARSTSAMMAANTDSFYRFPSLISKLCLALLLLSSLFPASSSARVTNPLRNPHLYTSHFEHFTHFKTHPNFQPEEFNITRIPRNTSVLAPGYIFMDPIFHDRGWGPQIYDIRGRLIWHGQRTNRSQNFHVCDFKGEKGTHLCTSIRAGSHPFPRKVLNPPPGVGTLPASWPKNMILDQTYTVVEYFQYGHNRLPMNVHAFEMWDDGFGFGTIVPQPRYVDLSAYGGAKGGWVRNQCVDDIDVMTKKSRFHWCYLEGGLEMWETKIFPNVKSATNLTFNKAGDGSQGHNWDFLHMNAVAKSKEGDYYMSIRYLDQIVKVAGPNSTQGEPGSILWRLGGHGNNFTFVDFPYNRPFTRTHDVRYISSNPEESEEVISVFNNAWEGVVRPSQPYSDAQFIRINTKDWTARLAYSYPHPKIGPRVAGGRGSVQLLPNDNVMVGWGKLPHMTEFTRDGEVLWHAHFSPRDSPNPHFSYRAFKSPWVGKPAWKPKMVAFCKTCSSPKIWAHVSWNGATEVENWRFFLGKDMGGPWLPAGTFPKEGFETKVHLNASTIWGFMSYVRVQALDINGTVLDTLEERTFVPPRKDLSHCDSQGCDEAYRYMDTLNTAHICSDPKIWPYLAIIFFILFIESSVTLADQVSNATLDMYREYYTLPEQDPQEVVFSNGIPTEKSLYSNS